jgi:nitric oxide reductase NorD protein
VKETSAAEIEAEYGDLAESSIANRPRSQMSAKTFHYNEWDFRAGDFRPRWCDVYERRVDEGETDFFDRTLDAYPDLVRETQRYFELMKPDPFRKVKRLEDGEDIDLDAAIDFVAQRKSGHGEPPKLYWRRNKADREVAVAILLDMSSSTDARLKDHHWPPKRIIDLAKESLVLLTSALEVIGDCYGIFGFSGSGRHKVDYFLVKDFGERFGDSVRRRIDRIAPVDATRMGAAIRHTTMKLMEVEARTRVLFLISDGRPQDVDYGAEPGDSEYAIHDTHMAMLEARGRGITPFALTVDKEGHDYLGRICGDLAYEVVDDIKLLPSRLPTLYRMLTE